MSDRTYTVILCDRPKHAENDEEVVGVRLPPLVINGVPKTLDLCEDCQAEMSVVDLLELAENNGTPLAVQKRGAKTPGKRGPVKGQFTESPDTWNCHYCTLDYNTPQGRTQHERKAHTDEWERDHRPRLNAEKAAKEARAKARAAKAKAKS